MLAHAKPRQARVQFADPNAPGGAEIATADFLKECRDSAMARLRVSECFTVEHVVPPKLGDIIGSTGTIIAHISPALWDAWEANTRGTTRERFAHVDDQVQLALGDLAEQDMHGYLALTEEQCAIYAPDLEQLIAEAFGRTTFDRLGHKIVAAWEGTLVDRIRPPRLFLVVSVGLAR